MPYWDCPESLRNNTRQDQWLWVGVLVKVLPDGWEMPEIHRFLRSVEILTWMPGEGNATCNR